MPDFSELYNPDLGGGQTQVPGPDLTPVNNPYQGYNPDQGINHADTAIAGLDRSLNGSTLDKSLQPVAYNPNETNAARYQNSDYFGQLGFNPFINNEENYGLRQTNWNKLGSAFGGAWSLIKNQFMEQATSWGDTFDFFKNNKSAFEQADFDEINKQQKEMMNNHPIFETKAQREGLWNFNTIANTIQQSGYAVGAIAEIAAEELALSALTAATFGGASEIQAARSAQLATKIGNVLRKTQQLEESVNTAGSLRKVFETLNRVNPIGDNTLEFMANLKNISRADKIAYGGSKLATARTVARGFGSFYRDVREFNAAIAEAKAEAAGSYQDLKSVLTDDYAKKYGKQPDADEAKKIDTMATEAAQTNGVANTYLIMLSNKIGLQNVMGGFKPLRQLTESAATGILEVGEKRALKTGAKFVDAADNKWLNFKQNLLRRPLGYLRTNIDEALQENLQNISHDAIQNYYEAKYNNDQGSPLKDTKAYITEAAAKQFSVDGAKTFISGFLTGAIIGPGEAAFRNSGNIQQAIFDRPGYQQRQAEAKAGRAEMIAASNNIYNNPLKFDYKQGDTIIQANLGELLKNAAQSNDRKAFYDMKDDALRHLIITGIRSNTLDTLLDRVKGYTKNLSKEEFTTAFGLDYNDKNTASIDAQVNNFNSRAEEIKTIHEQISDNLTNPFNPYRFKTEDRQVSNPEFVTEALGHKAWNDAVDNLVFIKGYYQDTLRGQVGVLNSLKNRPGFKSADFNDIYTLTSQQHLNTEIDTLQEEITSLSNPGIDAQSKVLLEQKKAKLSKLNQYKKNLDQWSEEFDTNSALPIGEARNTAFDKSYSKFKDNSAALFGEILNSGISQNQSQEAKEFITTDHVNQGFDSLHNYLKLQKESGLILDKVNLLADPENFSKFFAKHDELIRKAYEFSTKLQQAAQEVKGDKKSTTVNWTDQTGTPTSFTFTEGETYVGKMSQIEKYRNKNSTPSVFNNDKIKIVGISEDGKTITISSNGDASVDIDAEELGRLAKEQNWAEYSKLSPIQRSYLSLRNVAITYRILDKDSKGFITRDPNNKFKTKDVVGRVKLNDKKDTLLFTYKDGNKQVTIEFNPKYVINKQDLSALPSVEQAALLEQQARIKRNLSTQTKIFEGLYNNTEQKVAAQQQLVEANKAEFTKLQSDLKELHDELDLAGEELARIKGKRNIKEYREMLKELSKKLSKEIGEKTLLLERLTTERDALQESLSKLKEASLLYAEAFIELEDSGTPFDRDGRKNIYDNTQDQLDQVQKSQISKKMSDQQILDLIDSTEQELGLANERIKIVADSITAIEKVLNKVLAYDDLMEVLSNVRDPKQQQIYLFNLKRSETDPEKKEIISALLKSAKGEGILSGIFFEQAKDLKAFKAELAQLLERAASLQDKYDRLTTAFNQRGDINALQDRVDFLKQVQAAISTQYDNILAQQALVKAEKSVIAKTKGIAQELAEYGDIMSTEPVVTSSESIYLGDVYKPRLDQVGLFKTADRHYMNDTDAEPTSPHAARFFKFSEHVVPNGEFFFQVITENNDSYGIRRPDIYKDDVKILVVKKVGNEYKAVGVDGAVLDNPNKDNIVYTSIQGNEQLLGKDEDAIKWVEENYATKGMTPEEIKGHIDLYKAFRESIKTEVSKGTPVYLNIKDKSTGIQVHEPLDVNTKRPQELPVEGRLISEDGNWANMKHPDGTPIQLKVSTTGSVLNKKIKPGRLALVKDDGSIFQVYNRQLNTDEQTNIIGVLKALAPLMGRRYLTPERLSQIKNLLENGSITPERARELSNPLTESEQDLFDKSISYITSVLYWKPLKEGEVADKNQFRVANGMIYRGDIAIPFNAQEIEKNKDILLGGVYHQVNNKRLEDKNVFYELRISGDNIIEKKWDNYVKYLLDGSNDRKSPIYTNVKPYVSRTDTGSNQLRSVYLTYTYKNETAPITPAIQSTPIVNTQTGGSFTDLLNLPKDQPVVFVRKRLDKITDLFIVTKWDGSRYVVTKMIDQNGEDFTSNKPVADANEKNISSLLADIKDHADIPQLLPDYINNFARVYNRVESYNGQGEAKPVNSTTINGSQTQTGTPAGSTQASTPIEGQIKVGNSYTLENGTLTILKISPDGKTINTSLTMADGEVVEGSGTLAEIKAVIAQPVNVPTSPETLDAKIAAAKAQANLRFTSGDPIDENARLALTEHPEVKENVEQFKEWMSTRLPQVQVNKVMHLIDGRNWGKFIDGAIQLYQNAEAGTGYHEAFEAVWNSYLTPEEQRLLGDEFKQREGAFKNPYSQLTKKHSDANAYDVREMLADEFKDYIMQDKAVPKTGSPVRNNLFRKLWNFIKKILGLENTQDGNQMESYISKIYSKIESGGFINAEVVSHGSIPSNRALPGTTVDFTGQVMEGMASVFFSKLYSSQNNIESLFGRGDNSQLFNTLYGQTKEAMYSYFNGERDRYIKALQDQGLSEEQVNAEIGNYISQSPFYEQKQGVLNNFDTNVYREFKKFLGQFGLEFKKTKEVNTVEGEHGDELNDIVNQKEQDTVNTLGIRDSIFVDPRNMTKSTIRLLVASLTSDEYKPNSYQIQIKKNGLGLPTLEDYGRKINILLNELNGLVPVFKNGKRVETLDQMFGKLDSRFMDSDGKYRDGFQWIQRLKNRLKYDTPIAYLNSDEIRLLVGFETSFSNNKNLPIKLLVGEDGYITGVDPISVTNVAKIKERWQNAVKNIIRPLRSGESLSEAPISYIDPNGYIVFNLKSDALDKLMSANNTSSKIEALRKLGIGFTQSNTELTNDIESNKAIAESFNSISYAFKEGLINSFDDLFGKQVVNGPMSELLSIELKATAEDNILSHQNAEGKQQFSITLPSAVSNVLNSLKAVSNIRDFILSNPQFGSIGSNGEIMVNSYLENSNLFRLDGMLFDKNGNKKKDLDYQYILGMSLLTDNQGDNTDSLKFPDKLVQEIYHLLNGTYFTVINSDKSSEFGIHMGHFISWQDIKKPIAENTYVQEAYTNALIDEVNAAVFEVNTPSSIQYYSDGVTSLGHFRDILGFKTGKEKSPLQKTFETNVLAGKETARDFSARPQVQALILAYIGQQVEQHKQFLVDQGLVKEVPVSDSVITYSSNAFSKEQLDSLGIKDGTQLSDVEYTNLVKFMTLNRQIGTFEQHKLLYGHPAMYKDLAKRSNGINSQKEVITENRSVHSWMDSNMARNDGKVRSVQEHSTMKFTSYRDPMAVSRFHTNIAQGLYDSMIQDMPKTKVEKLLGVKANSEGTVVEVKGGKGTFMEAYVNANEPDGGAYIMPDFFRDMLFLSGKLGKEQEAYLKWEFAQEVIDRSDPKSDYFKEYTPQQIAEAKTVLAEGQPKAIIQTLKPQGFGYQLTEGVIHTTFLKHSVFPLTWSRVRDNPTMRSLYLKSQAQQLDVIGFESGEKVGNVMSNGEFTPLYNEKGEFNNQDLPIQEMLTKYYGIQVEMPSKVKDKVILGTQMRKLVLSNLPESLRSVADEYFKVLEDLMKLDKENLLKELGLKRTNDGTYETDNLEGLINTLRAEAISRDLPDNVIDMLNIIKTEAGDQLAYKFDANPIREKIDNILNSIVDSRVISQKMSGKASVQVPSTMWEKNPRDFVYLKDGVWTSVEGNTLNAKEQASVRMTSSDLKFYTKEEPWMEVMLPYYFKDILPQDIDLSTVDPRLLTAIGFRIPTQGMNSIENIRIKGFLDPSLGDVVVVPTEIVGKSGSDFDIDKLNLFLANYYVDRDDFGSDTFNEFMIKDMVSRGMSLEDAHDIINDFSEKDWKEINQSTYTEHGKERLGAKTSLKDIAESEDDLEEIAWVKRSITNYNASVPNKGARIKYIESDGTSKEALQNRLIELMSQIISHPDNYRQLVMPNGSSTLESLAEEIRQLKGEEKEGASLTKLSEWENMVKTRERYISGKKLVGIGALHITSHTISQLGDVELTGTYKTRDGEELPVSIKFDNNSKEGKYYLTAVKDKGNQYISELLSEALTGFVDAAKNPFVFDLNLNLQTAATWFYLQKLGVPVSELAYLHTQPLIEKYFNEQAKNESYVNKANNDELDKNLVIFKAADQYFQKAFDTRVSLYELGKPDENGQLRGRRRGEYFRTKNLFLARLNGYRASVEKYSPEELRKNISQQNKEGYELTKEDALQQLSLLYDYLDYQEQAGFLTTFISSIAYDTAKTKNVIENHIQRSSLQQAYSDEFITKDSIDRVFDKTFLGEVKNQKEDIFNMFRDFFVVLHPNAQESFQKVLDKINNPAINMTKDKKTEVLNRFQNFFLTYLLHTTKFKVVGKEVSLNSRYGLFFGDKSLAKQLQEFQEDPKYKSNKALRQLFPLINSDRNLTDNIKLFNSRLSTYEINTISESLMNLKAQAESEGDTKLSTFVERVGTFAILQSGVQLSPITYTKVLPIDLYSERVGDILDRFTSGGHEVSADRIWKQFHQNNWYNSELVPKIKRYTKQDGLLVINGAYRTSKYDYVSTRELKPEYRGKTNIRREELAKQKKWDEMYDYALFERIKIVNEEGVDITDQQPNVFFRPINRLGNRMYMTEVSSSEKTSVIPKNEAFDESAYDDVIKEVQAKINEKGTPEENLDLEDGHCKTP